MDHSQSNPDEKNRLIEHLDKARANLNTVLARVEPDREIYPAWKLKQLLDHLAGWDDAVLAALQAHARGDAPAVTAPRGIDYYNAETVNTRETLPLAQSRREYEVTRQLLKQAVCEMPTDRFHLPFVMPWGTVGTVEQVIEIFVHHEYQHAREIEDILNQQS